MNLGARNGPQIQILIGDFEMRKTDESKFINIYTASFDNDEYNLAWIEKQEKDWKEGDDDITITLKNDITLTSGDGGGEDGKYTMNFEGYFLTKDVPEKVTLPAGTVLIVGETCLNNITYFELA